MSKILFHPDSVVDFGLPPWVPESLQKRGLSRLPDVSKDPNSNAWSVTGKKSFGDEFPDYTVCKNQFWECSCQHHQGGEFRRHMCSHILAVIAADNIPQIRPAINPDKPLKIRPVPNYIRPVKLSVRVMDSDEVEAVAGAEFDSAATENPIWELDAIHESTVDFYGGHELDEARRIELDPVELAEELEEAEEADRVEFTATATERQLINKGSEHTDSSFPYSGPIKCQPISSLILPPWATSGLKSVQVRALEQIAAHLEAGKRFVILDAPTGSGKSLIGYLSAQLIGARMNYITTSKDLQIQMLADFSPKAKLLWGKSNYDTADFPGVKCDSCDFEKKSGCTYCRPWTNEEGEIIPFSSKLKCPYQIAKRAAQASSVSILNTAYALACFNYNAGGIDNVEGAFGFIKNAAATKGFSRRGLSVYDEADELEKALMGFVECEIGPRILNHFKFSLPGQNSRWKTRIEWLNELQEYLLEYIIDMTENPQVENDKFVASCIQTRHKILTLLADLGDLQDEPDERRESWVYDEKDDRCLFRPVRIAKYGPKFLYDHSHLNLFMSATIPCPELFAADRGIDWEKAGLVVVPSTHPKERRPAFYRGIAFNTKQERDTARPKIAAEIKRIRLAYSGRMLVHTVSYDFTSFLNLILSQAGFNTITYESAKDRDDALGRFKVSQDGILLAPSMERGINLKHDLCRLNIIPQIPYPYLGDKQVSRRRWQPTPREGDLWYKLQAMSLVIQMYGRAMRDEEDWMRCFILDQSFGKLFGELKHLLPPWFVEAIVMDQIDPLIKHGIDTPQPMSSPIIQPPAFSSPLPSLPQSGQLKFF